MAASYGGAHSEVYYSVRHYPIEMGPSTQHVSRINHIAYICAISGRNSLYTFSGNLLACNYSSQLRYYAK